MPSFFTVSEPHPTVVKGTYMHSGRGGSGNYFRAPETTPAAGVPIKVPSTIPPPASSSSVSSSSPPRLYFSGRGGAGNGHRMSEAPAPLNLDEEYQRAQNRDETAAGHVGRGGAGNFFKTTTTTTSSSTSPPRRKFSTSSSRRWSAESGDSMRSGLWARISGSSLHH